MKAGGDRVKRSAIPASPNRLLEMAKQARIATANTAAMRVKRPPG
jgi:hypothetical protein